MAFAIISGIAGVDLDLGAFSLRSHGALRGLAIAAVALALRLRLGIDAWPEWLFRMSMLVAIALSVATWFRFLLTTMGGADSYGYVSASQLLASGRLIADAPIAEWLSLPNRLAVASPLGWAPSANGSGIAPAYPIGTSALMALFSLVGGLPAVWLVAPTAGLITLLLVYHVTRAWYDGQTALFAVALAAWNPLMITYAKQPMSDVPATMWIMLALLLALRPSGASAFGAGLAAGAAVITRPALLIAAAVMPLVAHRGDSPRRRAVLSGAGLAIGVAVQMAIQQELFGSALSTGYGATSALFSIEHITTNLRIFATQGWTVTGPLWIVGLILGVIAARPEPRARPPIILAAVAVPYLFYIPFDHWETLRYLLPGLVPLTVLVADGLIHLARWPGNRVATAAISCVFIAGVAGQSAYLLEKSSVFDVGSLEARYPLAGQWVSVNTPTDSVVLANQHSGSLRWYGNRATLRWDFLEPGALLTTVQELEARNATVYVALEGSEVEMFDTRFASVIDRLRVDHVGRLRNVHFRRLATGGVP